MNKPKSVCACKQNKELDHPSDQQPGVKPSPEISQNG